MPPVRTNHPKDRDQSGSGAGHTAQRLRDSSLVCDTPSLLTASVRYLLDNGVDPSHFKTFSPSDVETPTTIFDPSSGLPLPPLPSPYDSNTAGEQVQTASATAVATASSSSSTTQGVAQNATSPASSSARLPAAITSSSGPSAAALNRPGHTARPANHFMLFRSDYFARVKSLDLNLDQYSSLPTIEQQWAEAPDSVVAYYKELGRLTKEVHTRLHPGYKYKPRKSQEKQAEKEEKARKRQAAKAAAASKKPPSAKGASAKSPTTSGSKRATTTSAHEGRSTSLAPVDVRIYDPAQRKFARPPVSSASAPASESSRAAQEPPAMSPPPIITTTAVEPNMRSGGSTSPSTTSPAFTLYQPDDIESPVYSPTLHGLGTTPGAAIPTVDGSADCYIGQDAEWPGRLGQEQPLDTASLPQDCPPLAWSNELDISLPPPGPLTTEGYYDQPSTTYDLAALNAVTASAEHFSSTGIISGSSHLQLLLDPAPETSTFNGLDQWLTTGSSATQYLGQPYEGHQAILNAYQSLDYPSYAPSATHSVSEPITPLNNMVDQFDEHPQVAHPPVLHTEVGAYYPSCQDYNQYSPTYDQQVYYHSYPPASGEPSSILSNGGDTSATSSSHATSSWQARQATEVAAGNPAEDAEYHHDQFNPLTYNHYEWIA